jgi:hypothetical protein
VSAVEEYDDLEAYVDEQRDSLVRIIKHGDDPFVRALAMAAFVEHGSEPELKQVRDEIDDLLDRRRSS